VGLPTRPSHREHPEGASSHPVVWPKPLRCPSPQEQPIAARNRDGSLQVLLTVTVLRPNSRWGWKAVTKKSQPSQVDPVTFP
jgi:hypothetical protein